MIWGKPHNSPNCCQAFPKSVLDATISKLPNNAHLTMQNRDPYYDILRGLAIIMVIGIHTYADGAAHLNLFFRQFINCAVPIFLAVSGYFIGKKSFQERGSYICFLKRQVPRVYIPMVLWSIPWAMQAIHMGMTPTAAIISSLIGKFSVFYFIILIIQLYILTPLIQKFNYKHGGGYSVIVTVIGISLFDYFLRIRGVNVGLLASGGPFPVWMVFYVLGVLKAQGLKIPFQTSKPLLAAFIALIFCCIQIAAFHAYNGSVVHGIKFHRNVAAVRLCESHNIKRTSAMGLQASCHDRATVIPNLPEPLPLHHCHRALEPTICMGASLGSKRSCFNCVRIVL